MALITESAILSCKEWCEREEIGDEGARDLTEEGLQGLPSPGPGRVVKASHWSKSNQIAAC